MKLESEHLWTFVRDLEIFYGVRSLVRTPGVELRTLNSWAVAYFEDQTGARGTR